MPIKHIRTSPQRDERPPEYRGYGKSRRRADTPAVIETVTSEAEKGLVMSFDRAEVEIMSPTFDRNSGDNVANWRQWADDYWRVHGERIGLTVETQSVTIGETTVISHAKLADTP
ncbi:hypothetical protein HDIA_0767 [Hartmannibacter diazotrophicus]|uniref:Uncharacterized protein n=1 Tax=Hartmannibacter diazotrophicus TaxID=1482074 RepID=A0A2C9D2C5_9HYPH|nr:hypothetical protein [Hartmannibacter diazotrophicus]SON54308.1 hypothetical protein HDIA_0767 [Hartmannibacter diazotrophicus]